MGFLCGPFARTKDVRPILQRLVAGGNPDGTIYVGGEGSLVYAIHPNGSLAWTFTTMPGPATAVVGTPIVGGDGTIYVTSDDRTLYAIHPDGTLFWALPLAAAAVYPPAIGADGTLYVTDDGGNLLAVGP